MGLLNRDRLEPKLRAYAQPSKSRQIGGDHSRNLRVTSGRMAISHQHDRLTVSRNLDGSRCYGIGCYVVSLVVMERPLTPKAHANTVRRGDGELAVETPGDLCFF